MSIPAVLATGRRLADSLMVDTCTITRTTGAGAQSETTGRITPTSTTVYAGPCQVRVPQAVADTPEVGGRTATIQQAIVKVPVAVTDIEVGDVVTVVSSTHDPELVGRQYRVGALHHKTYATARKFAVDEITA